jgi:excisionase family DNA binding protein
LRLFGVNNPTMHKSDQKQQAPARDELLTAEEVAALLRVTPEWVYAETRRHRIPHIRLGRYVRYRTEAIFLWMDELEGRSSAVPGRESSRSYPVDGASRRRI